MRTLPPDALKHTSGVRKF